MKVQIRAARGPSSTKLRFIPGIQGPQGEQGIPGDITPAFLALAAQMNTDATTASGAASTATTQAGIATAKAGEATTSATDAAESAASADKRATFADQRATFADQRANAAEQAADRAQTWDPANYALKDLSNTTGPRGKVAQAAGATDLNTILETGLTRHDPGAPNSPFSDAFILVDTKISDNGGFGTQEVWAIGFASASDSYKMKRVRRSGVWEAFDRIRETQKELGWRKLMAETLTQNTAAVALTIPDDVSQLRITASVVPTIESATFGLITSPDGGATFDQTYHCSYNLLSTGGTQISAIEAAMGQMLLGTRGDQIVPNVIAATMYTGSAAGLAVLRTAAGTYSTFYAISEVLQATSRAITGGRRNYIRLQYDGGGFMKAGSVITVEGI